MWFSKFSIKKINGANFSTYLIHKIIWKMFHNNEERNFVYYVDNNFNGYILSKVKPENKESYLEVYSKEINTSFIKEGVNLRIFINLNAIVTRDKKKYDAIEDRRISLLKNNIKVNKEENEIEAIYNWFKKREDTLGFVVFKDSLEVMNHKNNKIGKQNVTISSCEVSCIIKITNEDIFFKSFTEGIGSGRGFGFGMVLISNV